MSNSKRASETSNAKISDALFYAPKSASKILTFRENSHCCSIAIGCMRGWRRSFCCLSAKSEKDKRRFVICLANCSRDSFCSRRYIHAQHFYDTGGYLLSRRFVYPFKHTCRGCGCRILVLGIGCAPAGRRADGKRRTGGLLGGVWDAVMEERSTKKYPFCGERILKEAVVCRFCGRDLPQ